MTGTRQPRTALKMLTDVAQQASTMGACSQTHHAYIAADALSALSQVKREAEAAAPQPGDRERVLEAALEGMVDVFANGRGIDRSRAIGFCVLSDEGHAAINEARAALTDTGGTAAAFRRSTESPKETRTMHAHPITFLWTTGTDTGRSFFSADVRCGPLDGSDGVIVTGSGQTMDEALTEAMNHLYAYHLKDAAPSPAASDD